MSSKPKVLLLGGIEHAPAQEAWDSLSSIAELVTTKAKNRAEFCAECRSGAFDGLKVVYRTFESVGITGKINGEVVRELARAGCRFICHNGAGYDQIDVPACTSASIRVSHVPTAVDAATADTAIFLLLGTLRNYNAALQNLRQGSWRGNPPPPLGHDPEGKVLGILGMGGIGRNMKKKAEAFGMRVVYHNRKELSEDMVGGARYVGFEELLKTSDVVSLNLPLNPSTHHLLSTAQFALMKPTATLINTARGAIIDEAALVAALAANTIASVGLDVFENEPAVHPGLAADPRVLLLPHMGTWTVETQTEMELWNLRNVRAALEGGGLVSPVAEQEGMEGEGGEVVGGGEMR